MLRFRCHLLLLADAVGLWLLHIDDKLDWLALLLQCRLPICRCLNLQLLHLGLENRNPASEWRNYSAGRGLCDCRACIGITLGSLGSHVIHVSSICMHACISTREAPGRPLLSSRRDKGVAVGCRAVRAGLLAQIGAGVRS
jgi:hypothetical protein